MNRRHTLLILLFIFISQSLAAQYFKHLGVKEGLPQLSVLAIHQDKLGRMWFGTRAGIGVYDGKQMAVYKPWAVEGWQNSKRILIGNEVNRIISNEAGDVFIQAEGALIRYDIRKETFNQIRQSNISAINSYKGEVWGAVHDSLFIYDPKTDSLRFKIKTGLPSIHCLLPSNKQVWLGTRNGLYVSEAGKIRCILPGIEIYQLFESSRKEIWIATRMNGLYQITRSGNLVKHPYDPTADDCVASNQIRGFTEDNNQNIWFGTFNGVQVYNPYTNKFRTYRQEHRNGSLSHSSVFSVYKDRQGTIWVGTYYGGVNYFNPEKDIFNYYTQNVYRKDCLNFPLAGPILEDKDRNLWICTDGGGINCLNRKTNTFTYYMSGGSNSLPHNNVKSICYDPKRDVLYIGTYTGGLSRYDRKTGTFHNYLNEYNVNGMGPNNVIFQVTFKNDLLYVSSRNGFFVMNPDTNTFRLINNEDYYQSFEIDSNGYAWLSTGRYLYRISLNKAQAEREKFSLLQPDLTYKVSKILESRDGTIYIGTFGYGFFSYDPNTKKLTHYTAETKHLLSNYCHNLIETPGNNILITGDKGITLFSPFTCTSRSIELGKGGAISSIDNGCGLCVAANDEIFVGGADGMISFREKDLDIANESPDLYFSDLYIHNTKVYPGDDNNILDEALSFKKSIELRANQNNLVIHFSNSNYVSILTNERYEYRLEGFDSEWIPTINTSLHYNNLPPGNYKLKVREANNFLNAGDQQEIALSIIVHRPWYTTIWAWILYLIAAGSFIYWQWHAKMTKKILALSVKQEKAEKERNEEMHQSKLRFFTNLSHEFRTPLTLIIGQVESLLYSRKLPPTTYNKILKVYNNATHMRNLISELLDFRKQEQGYMKLQVEELDLVSCVNEVYESFYEYSKKKNIHYTFQHPDHCIVWFDPMQLKKVVFNLLSNAFKYTPPEGIISISIQTDGNQVILKIEDTGKGIPTESIHKIFECFYQVDQVESGSTPGTGIGLALTKGIVEAHRGQIYAESKVGEGSVFTVILLSGNAHFSPDEFKCKDSAPSVITEECAVFTEMEEADHEEMTEPTDKQPVMLIVEDSPEIMDMLEDIFSPIYTIHKATNGKEGFDLTRQLQPDIVLSDVMMPLMDGKEMCYKIKNSFDVSHIPVILLTAQSSVEYTIEGYMFGADDYVTKPFNVKLLMSRCNNLIKGRKQLLEKFSTSNKVNVTEANALNADDQKIINKAMEVIRNNFDNPDFDMGILASELCMGRSKLYSRMKEITGLTPNEFTLKLKLEEAMYLLNNESQYSVADICYRLGFASPRYFSRCFKTFYGIAPQNCRKASKES